MLSTLSRSALVGGWTTLLVVVVAVSVAMGASLSTTAFLFVLGFAPVFVVLLLMGGSPSPSVTQILHTLESRENRR